MMASILLKSCAMPPVSCRRTPLHLGSEFLRALLHTLFERFGQRAQLMLGSVTLAFALTQPFRGVHQHLANGVDLAHRQLTCSDRLALPERGCLRSKRTHRTCHSVADGIGEQHREDREQERDRSQRP